MWKNISLGMGATLAFAMSVYAQNYKINKVGSDEEKSFDVMLDQAVVSSLWALQFTMNMVMPENSEKSLLQRKMKINF